MDLYFLNEKQNYEMITKQSFSREMKLFSERKVLCVFDLNAFNNGKMYYAFTRIGSTTPLTKEFVDSILDTTKVLEVPVQEEIVDVKVEEHIVTEVTSEVSTPEVVVVRKPRKTTRKKKLAEPTSIETTDEIKEE